MQRFTSKEQRGPEAWRAHPEGWHHRKQTPQLEVSAPGQPEWVVVPLYPPLCSSALEDGQHLATTSLCYVFTRCPISIPKCPEMTIHILICTEKATRPQGH